VGSVAFVAVKQGESRNGFFGIGIELDGNLEFAFRFLQIVIQAIESAEQKMIVNVIGFDLDDLFVLLDGQLEHIVAAVAVSRHVAERAQIDTAQQLMSFEVVGVAFEDVLSFEHGIADASGLDVELGEAGGEEFGRRVGFDGEPVFLHRFIGQLAAAIRRHLLFVQMRQRVVVIRGGMVHFARRNLSRFGRSLGIRLRGWTGLRGRCRCEERNQNNAKNSMHARPDNAGLDSAGPDSAGPDS